MTTAGWLFMGLSISAVLTLVVFCYARVLRNPGPGSGPDVAPAQPPAEEQAP